jgi:hypothetical protein
MKIKVLGCWMAWAGLAGLGVAAGCGNTDSQIGFHGGAVNGEACMPIGATSPASDGCNTCTCGADGKWGCTLKFCDTPCNNGESRPSPDGCNTCTCMQNQWACTAKACVCTPGETKPAGDGCNTCTCSADHQWACTLLGCTACTPGQTKPAPDGCNTCTCSADGQQWACTDIACPVCMPGQTKPAGDGCNTCGCRDGRWACTLINCDCPAPRPPSDAQACDTVMVWAKRPPQATPVWGASCCLYNTACQAPDGWATFQSQQECQAAPQCPAPAPEDGRSCPPVTVYAKDPASGACCFYSDPCRAPMNWKTYSTEDECKAGP